MRFATHPQVTGSHCLWGLRKHQLSDDSQQFVLEVDEEGEDWEFGLKVEEGEKLAAWNVIRPSVVAVKCETPTATLPQQPHLHRGCVAENPALPGHSPASSPAAKALKEALGSLRANPTSPFIKGPAERCLGSPRAPRRDGKGSWGRKEGAVLLVLYRPCKPAPALAAVGTRLPA